MFLEQLENRSLLATVLTDHSDYAPGETASIFAIDFQAGETVKFQVLHTDGVPNTGGGHEPWSVQDGVWSLDGGVSMFTPYTEQLADGTSVIHQPDLDRRAFWPRRSGIGC